MCLSQREFNYVRLGKSVVISNGTNMSMALPECIRIQWHLFTKLVCITTEFIKSMLYELCKVTNLTSGYGPDTKYSR